MKKSVKRSVLSFVLVLALAVSGMSMGALAAEGDIVVSTGAELDAALKASIGTDSITIVLANDIDAIASATYTGYATGAAITIDGQGHKIDGQGVMDSGLRFGARGQELNLTVKNTVFANMSNDDRNGGGAIALWRGAADVSGSTFTGNVSTTGSRGGGGVMVQSGSASISNSTFVGNSANGSGGAIYAGSGTLNNVTVVGNSSIANVGGVNGAFTVTNSIISGNTTASETAAANVGATAIIADGNNVVDADIAGWLATALQENTLALLDVADSPAVDKANPATATAVDQRGVARDATPDIGAYELVKGDGPVINENVVSLVKADSSEFGVINVELRANFPSDKVNLVEFTLKYDASALDVGAVIPVTGAMVKKIVANETNGVGTAKIVIGVSGDSAIAADEMTTLANVVITPKADQTPEAAYIAISVGEAYAAGELVEYTAEPKAVYARFTYRDPMDVNGDGKISGADLSLVLAYFGATSADADWSDVRVADVNGDGVIDVIDVTILVDVLYA